MIHAAFMTLTCIALVIPSTRFPDTRRVAHAIATNLITISTCSVAVAGLLAVVLRRWSQEEGKNHDSDTEDEQS